MLWTGHNNDLIKVKENQYFAHAAQTPTEEIAFPYNGKQKT
jgi:hypothetical protein